MDAPRYLHDPTQDQRRRLGAHQANPSPSRRTLQDLPAIIKQPSHKCQEPGCHKAFHEGYHLKRHMKSHGNQKPHVCWVPGCQRAFARSDGLGAHTRTHGKRGGRNCYVATYDETSPAYDPDFRGQLTSDGQPIYASTLDKDERLGGSAGAQTGSGQYDNEVARENVVGLTDDLRFLSQMEYENVCRIATEIRQKCSPDDMSRIKMDSKKITTEQKDYLTKENLGDPVEYLFRVQALKELQSSKRSRMELASARVTTESGPLGKEDASNDGELAASTTPASVVLAYTVQRVLNVLNEEPGHFNREYPAADGVSQPPSALDPPCSAFSPDTAVVPETLDEARRPPPFTILYPDRAIVTDSGYASLESRKLTLGAIESSSSVTHPHDSFETSMRTTRPELLSDPLGDDTTSMYSEVTNLGTSVIDGYVATIAAELSETILMHETSEQVIERICEHLPRMLSALSLSIGAQKASRMNWEVMAFVQKYRRDIARAVRDLVSSEGPQWNKRTVFDGMSMEEKMTKWLLSGEDVGTTLPAFPDTASPTEVSDADSGEQLPPAIHAYTYTDMIRSAPSYAKLQADLRREIILEPSNPDIIDEVHKRVNAMLPRSRKINRRSPPEIFRMTYYVDWDPLAFLEEQEYEEVPEIAIKRAIVVTGSATAGQAITCFEYLQQTWPTTGPDVLQLVQNALRPPYTAVRSDRTPIIEVSLVSQTMRATRYLKVAVTGHAEWIGEIAEILAWIGSALRSSTNPDDMQYCSPSVEQVPTTASVQGLKCNISYNTETITRNHAPLNGQCWHNLFGSPVIAKGFPISRRPMGGPGLEMSLDLMSILTDTPRLNSFDRGYFIKGFSTMLVPTHYENNVMKWHLIYDAQGERIPYTDGVNLCRLETQMSSFQTARHILGWCSQSRLHAGCHDACYNVQCSRLPGVPEKSPLFNTSISMGQMITRETSYSLGKKDLPVHVTRNGYARKLKWISKKFVLLWDEEDHRGWLINGTSALLHLVRTALERDRAGELSSLIALDPSKLQYTHLHQPASAAWALANKSNLMQRVYEGDEQPTYFQDYVTGFYDLLEKMIDYQVHAVNVTRSQGATSSRSQLEGWDFDDLASERDPIYPRMAQLDASGRSWMDLIKSIHGVVLFGCKFGEVISPQEECPEWSSLPTGRSYLAVSRADLQEIITAGRGSPFSAPVRLTDSVIWYIPEELSHTCECKSSQNERHSDIAQILLPATMACKLAAKGSILAIENEGAVIFGYNQQYPWYWADSGEPSQTPSIQDRSQATTGSSSHDSGYGKSVSSAVALDEDAAILLASDQGMAQTRYVESCPEAVHTSEAQQMQSLVYSSPSTESYSVGVICALHKELKAFRMLFDVVHDNAPIPHGDPNHYAFGCVAKHNVVATCLPNGEYGTSAAADVASNMKRSFSRLRLCLLIGIGGGVPGKHDIRLGDVVVSTPSGASIGVLPYDVKKTLENGIIQINGYLHPSPRCLRSALSEIQSDPRLDKEPLAAYLQRIAGFDAGYGHPGVKNDVLFLSDYAHADSSDMELCRYCDHAKVQIRPARNSTQPLIHYGLIASGNQVIKSAITRDQLGTQYGIMCFEMEAAGIMNILPSLVIRGICDYCDSHKNKKWQMYAAATAASFAKLLLSRLRPETEEFQSGSFPVHTPLQPDKRGSTTQREGWQESAAKRQRVFE